MMKRSLVGAAFVVASIGAVGVRAGTTVNLKGSDTLFDFTNAMIAGCPGTAAPYAGTGSGNGQSAMLAGTQQVAPMSRFLNNGACSGKSRSRQDCTVAPRLPDKRTLRPSPPDSWRPSYRRPRARG